jgi:hypothetical protein
MDTVVILAAVVANVVAALGDFTKAKFAIVRYLALAAAALSAETVAAG